MPYKLPEIRYGQSSKNCSLQDTKQHIALCLRLEGIKELYNFVAQSSS